MQLAWIGWQLKDFQQNRSSWIRHNHAHNTNYVYVNIPKNASSWMKNNFGGRAYDFRSCQFMGDVPEDDSDIQAIRACESPPHYVIILRDPVSRWLSGSAQAFHSSAPSDPDFFMNWSDELLFNTVCFDTHTAPQHLFLENIDLTHVTWFDCTQHLSYNLQQWCQDKWSFTPRPHTDFEENVYKISELNKPQRLDTPEYHWTMKQCIQALEKRLSARVEHMERLTDFYSQDYALRDSVRFTGTKQ
jgi:hypothetical protein